jgi:hypothetical protein
VANDLTGDFDVVAEFSIPATNRVLAAMHSVERFLHSVTLRVDDKPAPLRPGPTVLGSVDEYGDATVDQSRVGHLVPISGAAANDPRYSLIDPIVNAGALVGEVVTITPSNLQGVAQMQLAPPTLQVPDATGKNITVRMEVMARYLADPHTTPLAEFIDGELQITTSVDQVASQSANVVDINIKAQNLQVNFNPTYSSQPLSENDLVGINLAISNALKTSLLPSNAALPQSISYVQFKTLLGGSNAIAVLLNMQGGAEGDPASLNDIFLSAADDFALAASAGYVESAFHVDLSQKHSWWEYNITLKSASIALSPPEHTGKIVVTVSGHAEGKHWYSPPAFDFTIHQDFTLQPAALTPGGPLDTLELVAAGGPYGGLTGDALNLFGESLLTSATQQQVEQMFSADANLGGFLDSLLVAPGTSVFQLFLHPPARFQLTYTSADIQPSGIVVHGALAALLPPSGRGLHLGPRVVGWPPPHVEFEQIPATSSGPIVGVQPSGPDYSALLSWIPGGRITSFEWSYQGQSQPFFTDNDKFILLQQPTTVSAAASVAMVAAAYTPLCLTIKGTRISPSGPEVYQAVSGTQCAYTSLPVVNSGLTATGSTLSVALAQASPSGQLVITGHTPAQVGAKGANTPNLLLHFADAKSTGQLQLLTSALAESGRQDATTVVLAVLTPALMAKAPYVAGITYADDQGGAWEKLFKITSNKRPLTLVVGPQGKVGWQQEGQIDSTTLVAALKKSLVAGGPVGLSVLGSSMTVGQPPPNFLYEFAPGRELPLRKLVGRAVTLVFWSSLSQPSIDAVRDQQQASSKAGVHGPIVLAINDGESPEVAKRVAAENGLTATIVTDPQREISSAYGVSLWPTIVFLDASGLVTGIRYGRVPGQQGKPPSASGAASSR